MLTDKLTNYFLPAGMRYDKAHARYDEFHVLISNFLLGYPIMGAFGVFLLSQGKYLLSYFIFAYTFTCLVVLFSIKYFSHYCIPMGVLAIFARSLKNNFEFTLSIPQFRTRIEVAIPYAAEENNSYKYAQQDHHH